MHADGEKKNSGFFICANLRHLRAILDSVAVFRAVFVALFVAMSCLSVSAQIQQAWVARCNNGITNGTHQAVKMALDPVGNVYVTGFSQNTNGNLDYLTLKYAPNGNQVWTARFDSTNTATAKPAAIVLDTNGNIIVTGNAVTVKYDNSGNQLWTAPYAGAALAVDSTGNVCITGYSTDLGTVKLNPSGSNLWTVNYPDIGATNLGQAVAFDTNGNAYVAGSDAYIRYQFAGITEYYVRIDLFKYDPNGNQIWMTRNEDRLVPNLVVAGVALDYSNNIYMIVNYGGPTGFGFFTMKYANTGNWVWTASDPTDGNFSLIHGIALDNQGNAFVTGNNAYQYPSTQYGTYKIDANGPYDWTNLYPALASGVSVATAIAVDLANNVYVTGYSPGTNSGNDIVTIKYDSNGNQIWLQRYNGPGNGDDEGNAIAVDANGNVYVAGYETTAAGGTEMVLIKYAPGRLSRRRPTGAFCCKRRAPPGRASISRPAPIW